VNLDTGRLKRVAPLALPLAVAVLGWLLLIRPAMVERSELARQLSGLQQRLADARRSLAEPPPADVVVDARASFERRVASRDASARVFERLARVANEAEVSNLAIETGERAVVTGGAGPQPMAAAADPRLAWFEVPLTYLPITMAFDATYAGAGQLLWQLRDLPTVIDIRTLELTPVTGGDGQVHVTLSLFAFARHDATGAPTGELR